MKRLMVLLLVCFSCSAIGQAIETDSFVVSKVTVDRDVRLDVLTRKLAELNHAEKKLSERTAMGYRLQVLSTNDRQLAMQTRTSLLQKFPDQKTYMFYQAPFVKLRFGNFRSKDEAEVYKKQISRMMGGASIYTVSERIEVKPEKDKEEEEN